MTEPVNPLLLKSLNSLLLLAFLCLCVAGRTATPQVNLTLNWDKASIVTVNAKRAQVSLAGIWRFAPAAEGTAEPPKVGWAYIKVPGSWQNPPGRPADLLALGGGPPWDLYDGARVARAWYERQVPIPAEWRGRAISLRFERLCTDAMVYVNGTECGRIAWPWGSVEITPAVTPGQTAGCWWRPSPMRNRWGPSGRMLS
ncbi:MAG: hypothetical protein NTW03_17085 [Verrucomicrobia bacterium]|nr:hypothetical protein [Verrucomicrobiota bacterium]